MNRTTSLLPILLLASACASKSTAVRPTAEAATPPGNPIFLWEVRKEGLAKPSYLLGTFHALPAGTQLPARFHEAFDAVERLVVEVDLEKVDPTTAARITFTRGTFLDGDTLDKHLTPETWARVQQTVAELGLPPEVALRMKPWLLAVTIPVLQMQKQGFAESSGVERQLLKRAYGESPKPVLALESMEGQLAVLAGLPTDVQIALLEDAVESSDRAQLDTMVDAWLKGDTVAFEAITFLGAAQRPAMRPFYEAMFDRRNEKMAEQVDALLGEGGPLLVAVGAGHMVGPTGLVKLLQDRGYSVEQVRVIEEPVATAAR